MCLLGAERAIWYVPDDEIATYQAAGAERVVAGGGLVEARNLALDHAFADGLPCVQLSDDLKRTSRLAADGSAERIPLEEAIDILVGSLGSIRLAGVAPTDNPFFAKNRINPSAFIVGDLFAAAPSDPRFDPALKLKEDYDYTCQHMQAYGAVARHDYLLASFKHRTNPGGAVAYRTSDLEQEAIAILMAKWPGLVVKNSKRANEVLLRLGSTPSSHKATPLRRKRVLN